MALSIARPYSRTFDQAVLTYNPLPQRLLGGSALVCAAFACAFTLGVNLDCFGSTQTDDDAAGRTDRLPFAASRADRLDIAPMPRLAEAGIENAPFDSRFSTAFPAEWFVASAPLAVDDVDAESTAQRAGAAAQNLSPTPLHARQLALHSPRNFKPPWSELGQQTAAAANPPANKPSFFERLFGRHSPSIFEKLFGSSPSRVTLAYAAPEGVANDGGGVAAPLYDRQTAVYDISAHTVYMPDGRKLEAHSGLGSRLDDPRYADEKGRGATPPDIYTLEPRERLFHGVRALRLIPVEQSKVFGRKGLLAHTYMLGPNGQSFGCVSFKDYEAFLQAYQTHQITRLAVVSHID